MSATPSFERFGRYLLLHRIAIGGMAEIFLAIPEGQRDSSRLLVIKRIREDLCNDETFVEMFIDEARVVSRLAHPNIIKLLEFGQVDGRYFIALEHIWGESLRTLTLLCTKRKMRFPMGAALFIGARACRALDYAHQQRDKNGEISPVIHRDVTLGNVVVSYGGDIKVLDYGIAKAKGRMSQTRAGQIKGTLSYLAPEQLRGQPMGPHTDIYQLGVMLYQTLVGRLPVEAESEGSMMASIVAGHILRPSQVVPGFPVRIERLLLKAMAREPEQRFASAAELQSALEELIAGTPYAQGTQRLSHMVSNITGDRRDKQQSYIRGLLQGLQVDATQAEIFKWAGADDAPATLAVELSAILDDSELDEFEDAPTIVMSSDIGDFEVDEPTSSDGDRPLADAGYDPRIATATASATETVTAPTIRAPTRRQGDPPLAHPDDFSDVPTESVRASALAHRPGADAASGPLLPDETQDSEHVALGLRPQQIRRPDQHLPAFLDAPISASQAPDSLASLLGDHDPIAAPPGQAPELREPSPPAAKTSAPPSQDDIRIDPGSARRGPQSGLQYASGGMNPQDFDAILGVHHAGRAAPPQDSAPPNDLGYDGIVGRAPHHPSVQALAQAQEAEHAGLHISQATTQLAEVPDSLQAPPAATDGRLAAADLFGDLSSPVSVLPEGALRPIDAEPDSLGYDPQLDAIAEQMGLGESRGGHGLLIFALFVGVLSGLITVVFIMVPDLPGRLLHKREGRAGQQSGPDGTPLPAHESPVRPSPGPAADPSLPGSTPRSRAQAAQQPEAHQAQPTSLGRLRIETSVACQIRHNALQGDSRLLFDVPKKEGRFSIKVAGSTIRITVAYEIADAGLFLSIDANRPLRVSSGGLPLGPTPQSVGPGFHFSLQLSGPGLVRPLGVTINQRP